MKIFNFVYILAIIVLIANTVLLPIISIELAFIIYYWTVGVVVFTLVTEVLDKWARGGNNGK